MGKKLTKTDVGFAKTITIGTTRNGRPAMWERGGATNGGSSGECQLIAGLNGDPLMPVYVRTKGDLACKNHALIAVQEGNYVFNCRQQKGEFTIKIWQIVEVNSEQAPAGNWMSNARLILVNYFHQNEWSAELDSKFKPAYLAALTKAKQFHARRPIFIDQANSRDSKQLGRLREAQIRARAENKSAKDKKAGLEERMKAVNRRLWEIGLTPYELGAIYFLDGKKEPRLYTKKNVTEAEAECDRIVKEWEKFHFERVNYEDWKPHFEYYLPRAIEIGWEIYFHADAVKVTDDEGQGQFRFDYTEDGVLQFLGLIEMKEKKLIKKQLVELIEMEGQIIQDLIKIGGMSSYLEIQRLAGIGLNSLYKD